MEVHGPHQRVGADDARRRTRAALHAGEHAEQRLLRRPPSRLQSLRRVAGVPRCRYRQAQVALPARAPRPVGLRPGRAAQPREHSRQRTPRRRGGAAHQAGLRVRLRSRHRAAGMADRRAARAAERRAWRAELAHAALPHQARAVRGAGRVARRRVRPHAGVEGRGTGRDAEVPARPGLHAGLPAGHHHATGCVGRRQLGRRGLRSRVGDALSEDRQRRPYHPHREARS